MPFGITVKHDSGSSRIEIQCKHQNGLVYVVPGESSWVCTEELMHVHALAGFLRDLTSSGNLEALRLMQKWGLYYRERALSTEGENVAGE
jgi:hypothetical protein